jgi:hypothetical protein
MSSSATGVRAGSSVKSDTATTSLQVTTERIGTRTAGRPADSNVCVPFTSK